MVRLLVIRRARTSDIRRIAHMAQTSPNVAEVPLGEHRSNKFGYWRIDVALTTHQVIAYCRALATWLRYACNALVSCPLLASA